MLFGVKVQSMLILKPHKNISLNVLSEETINAALHQYDSQFKQVSKNQNLLVLTFESTKIVLPITSSMTWGQLINSLIEKGLIAHE